MKRKVLALVLCVLMVFGCVSVAAADEGDSFDIFSDQAQKESFDDFEVVEPDSTQEDVLIFAPEEEEAPAPAAPAEETETVKAAQTAAPEVISASLIPITSVTLKYTSRPYIGKAITQTGTTVVKAKVNGKTKTLTKGTDYTISYKNNVNVGTATVIVKGKGKYTGTIKKTFKITAVPLTSVSIKYTSKAYTGKAITQTGTTVVKAKVNGKTKTLTKGTDYSISYSDNINVGTATITVKGKGNYKGTIKKTFKITAVPITSATLKYYTMGYTGSARTQSKSTVVTAEVSGKTVTLTYGTDYSVSYLNNVEVGIATAVIKGKGNFKGTIKEKYLIVEKPAVFLDPSGEWSIYDDLISQIRTETDKAARTELMHQAEDILMATNAVVPIYYYNDVYMQKEYAKGIYANVYGTKYFREATLDNGSDTLRLCIATEPYTIDPGLCGSVDGAILLANSFSGLFTYDANGIAVPDCAESYTVSEDGKTYTVTLKDGLKWSDGTDLTAADFEYSWKRVTDPETNADYAYLFEIFDGYGSESGINVTATDDKTLVFVLTAPCAYMEDLLSFQTFYPVQQAWIEAHPGEEADAWCKDAGFPSNGAFVCTGWNHDESMTYEKNPYYWNADAVSLVKLEYVLAGDENAVYEDYEAGNLDFIDFVPSDALPPLIKEQSPELRFADNLGTYYLAFNVKSPMFEGKTPEQAAAMREAISLLIDRDYIVNSIGKAGQTIATTFVPVGMADGNGGIFHASNKDGYYEPNAINDDSAGTITKATALLKSAGFKFDQYGILSEETPLQFEYATNGGGHSVIAESIRTDLAVLGIKVTVTEYSWNTFLEIRKNGEFDLVREGWIADFNDPINMLEMFTTESGNNDAQFGR